MTWNSCSPQSVKSVCGQVLDSFGDHLRSCGYGSLRTRRHNLLCDVICNALVTDNKYAKRGQQCSSYDASHPGDIFHPDFLDGRDAYFDITVSNSLQPSAYHQAAVKAGAAAEHAEVRKDDCREARIMAVGGEFTHFWLRLMAFGLLQVCKH